MYGLVQVYSILLLYFKIISFALEQSRITVIEETLKNIENVSHEFPENKILPSYKTHSLIIFMLYIAYCWLYCDSFFFLE